MKKVQKSILVGWMILSLIGCQQVPSANNNGGYNDGTGDTGNEIELCPDGTLNCLVDLPEGDNVTIINTTSFDTSFDDCMNTCLDSSACAAMSLDAAQDSCPESYNACVSTCEWSSDESPYAHMPSCEPIGIPETPKAIKVEITACIDAEPPMEIHFDGPSTYFEVMMEGKRSVDVYGYIGAMWGNAKLGYGVGRNPKCDEAYKNRVKVKFTPIVDSSVTIGSQTIAVTPFSNSTIVEKNYARPDNLSFGIPESIRNEADLSQMAWMVTNYGTPSNDMKEERYGFCHYKNDKPYGTSIVMIDYDQKTLGKSYANQTITMYLLVKGM